MVLVMVHGDDVCAAFLLPGYGWQACGDFLLCVQTVEQVVVCGCTTVAFITLDVLRDANAALARTAICIMYQVLYMLLKYCSL